MLPAGRQEMRKIRQVRVARSTDDNSMNTFLYLISVLIWGTSWIAIKFELGVVPAPVSIAYRFWIAVTLLLLCLLVVRRPVWPPRQAWRYLLA
jgi:drug/metabolite transporter (DMT)-like permease